MMKNSWRDVLPVHPAANLFPLMSNDELRALARDIKEHGLLHKVVLTHCEKSDGTIDWDNDCVLDGRNRLDALERIGYQLFDKKGKPSRDYFTGTPDHFCSDDVPLVMAANIHRRHLSREQRDELITTRASPERSDRYIASVAKVNHKTVGSLRAELESTGEIPQLESRLGADGRARPQHKPVDQSELKDKKKRRSLELQREREEKEQKEFVQAVAAQVAQDEETARRAAKILHDRLNCDELAVVMEALGETYGDIYSELQKIVGAPAVAA